MKIFLSSAALFAVAANASVYDWLPEKVVESTTPETAAYLEGGVASCWYSVSTDEEYVDCIEAFVDGASEDARITDPAIAEAIVDEALAEAINDDAVVSSSSDEEDDEEDAYAEVIKETASTIRGTGRKLAPEKKKGRMMPVMMPMPKMMPIKRKRKSPRELAKKRNGRMMPIMMPMPKMMPVKRKRKADKM